MLNPLKLFSNEEPSSNEGRSSPGSIDYERTEREIRGSIFSLLTLFLLISLTSYLPIDTINLFHGRLGDISNLAGIVGAMLAESLLGSLGIAGYAAIILTLWLAYLSFRGGTIRRQWQRIMGVLLGTCLTSIACQLLLSENIPEASLLQGGWLGRSVGTLLRDYFNTTGALLLVGGGYAITLILTTRFSFLRSARYLFDGSDEDTLDFDDDDLIEQASGEQSHSVAKVPVKNHRKAKAASAAAGDAPDSEESDAGEHSDDQNDPDAENAGAPTASEFQPLIHHPGKYATPSLRLLKSEWFGAKKLSRSELKESAEKICEHLLSFQIIGDIETISQGPILTTYEYKPSAGIKLSKIASLQNDLGVVLGTRELRVVAPIPGKTVVGIEVPRPAPEVISLKDILREKAFYDKDLKLPIALGKSTDGKPLIGDLTAMPHLLVAGATGSGKSVFINTLIMSLLFRLTPQELRLILIDPKMLELSVFDGIPHLITNVITNNNIAFNALCWAVDEMERRYNLMAETNSKNLVSYNSKMKSAEKKLPYIVIVIDELADLMLSGGEEAEVWITRLAQKARAAGIHLVIATQRPSTDVITGLIKANIPSRMSFKVPSSIDSRTILDASGAEKLIGRGDSFMIQPAVPIKRIHACYVSEEELQRVVKYVIDGKKHDKYYVQLSAERASDDE